MEFSKYARHAEAVFAVFEMLRRELAAECDDSAVLNRLHEIAALPQSEFFAAVDAIATDGPNIAEPALTRCAPLPGDVAR
ncbi:hypothetical protein [Paraburkholderia sp. A3RO-2L]|uniref:hypothetical protein n=1 Tax=unclassified Paraburkholderia TaxID=2615204 RepID=UPI003DA97EEB